MLVPALLPAKLATAYKLANTVKTASAFAKKIGLTDQDAVQYVKNNILGGKDLSSLIAGKENVIAKSISQFTGKTDTGKEYTEKTIAGPVEGIINGISPELQTLMAKGKSYSETDIIPSKHAGADLAKFVGSDYDVKTSLEKTPELQKKMNDAVDKAVNDYLGKVQSGEIPFPDNLQLEMDKVGNDARHNIIQSQEIGLFSGGRVDKALGGRNRYI